MDSETTLEKIAKLCTQLQTIAKKNPIARAGILSSLQEILTDAKTLARDNELLSTSPTAIANANLVQKHMKRVESLDRGKRPPSRLAPLDRSEHEGDNQQISPKAQTPLVRTNSLKPLEEQNVFRETLIAYSFKAKSKHPDTGGNVILPPSCLKQIELLGIPYPLIVEVKYRVIADTGYSVAKTTHCGVLEFTSDENSCYLPSWVMKQLSANEGALINFRSITNLPKATFIKFQPHSSSFLEISNPNEILEYILQNFSVLSIGDSISVVHNYRHYQLDVLEVQPPCRHHAILLVDTEMGLDFATPLDQIKEASPKPNRLRYSKSANYTVPITNDHAMEEEPRGSISFRPFSGKGYVLGNSKDHSAFEEENLSFRGKGLKGSV